ncbi:unnamed protein product, partial [marine sediment metagenome]
MSRATGGGEFVPFAREDLQGSIPARFERQARNHPARPAIVSDAETVSYDALNRKANAIARGVLREVGADDTPVALLFDTHVNFIATVMGVLKAGKSYVPLDPSYPLKRKDFILSDVRSRLILTDCRCADAAS